jgi:hypothetical protein
VDPKLLLENLLSPPILFFGKSGNWGRDESQELPTLAEDEIHPDPGLKRTEVP